MSSVAVEQMRDQRVDGSLRGEFRRLRGRAPMLDPINGGARVQGVDVLDVLPPKTLVGKRPWSEGLISDRCPKG